MSAPAPQAGGTKTVKTSKAFWIAFAVVILLIAGGVSYLASSSPDGLDSATLKGCEVVEVDGAEQLTGNCIAQQATDHPLSASPLADYSIGGDSATGGVAGVIGAIVTLAVAAGLFWLIARRKSGS